jgi:hypothetical protein
MTSLGEADRSIQRVDNVLETNVVIRLHIAPAPFSRRPRKASVPTADPSPPLPPIRGTRGLQPSPSRRVQQHVDPDGVEGKHKEPIGGFLQHAGAEQRMDIAVHALHVPLRPSRCLAERDRSGAGQSGSTASASRSGAGTGVPGWRS